MKNKSSAESSNDFGKFAESSLDSAPRKSRATQIGAPFSLSLSLSLVALHF